MRKKDDSVRYTAEEVKAKIARRGRTNWAKADSIAAPELEASIRADVDDVQSDPDWTQAVMGIPFLKDHVNIRIDHDVLAWFKSNGRGYQTVMNNVLHVFVQSRQSRQHMKSK